jgi:hypothetical protein
MPLPAVLGLLALMAAAVLWGFAGPAARRPRTAPIVVLLAAGLASLPCGMLLTEARQRAVGMLAISAGVLLLSVAAHLLRAPARPGDDDGPAPAEPPPGPPVDWDAFDRERERWDRVPPRPRSGAH